MGMGQPQNTASHAMTAYARCTWCLIAAMAALTVASFLLTGLRVDPLSRPLLLVPFSVLGVT
jgi:hypothetical protein